MMFQEVGSDLHEGGVIGADHPWRHVKLELGFHAAREPADGPKDRRLEGDEPGVAPGLLPRAEQAAAVPDGSIRTQSPFAELGDSRRRHAMEAALQARDVVGGIVGIIRGDASLRLDDAREAVDAIAVQVERDAPMLLSTISLLAKGEPRFFHSVSVCALIANLARYLGMKPGTVRELGLAGLLHDIGKTTVPSYILNKPDRLTEDERELVRGHSESGHRILAAVPGISPVVLEVCRHHHEKYDGTGYPLGLKGEAIGFAARLSSICDTYDALTADRVYKRAWSPMMAIGQMWSWDGHFDRSLLFSFMKSIGIFPPGLLVRLRSDRLGIVLRHRRIGTRPRALTFYCARDRAPVKPEIVSLDRPGANDRTDPIVSLEEPDRWGFGNWTALSAELMERSASL